MRYILCFLVLFGFLWGENFPTKPITIVVGFGEGGSSDRNMRILAPFLSHELGVEIKIINIKGDASNKALSYVLKQPQNGYTIFATTFCPYITVNILEQNTKISPNDLSILNIQWYDYDLIAVNNSSNIKNISDLITRLKSDKPPLKVGNIRKSVGDLTLDLLLQKLNIPQNKIKKISFESGRYAREALVKKQVDFIISGSQGSEPIRDFITTLAIVKDQRVRTWDAPTLNRALESYGIKIPIITSLRGYGVGTALKEKYPFRYKKLLKAFENVLALKKVQNILRKNYIGSVWVGDEKSNEYFLNSFETIKKFSSVISPQK